MNLIIHNDGTIVSTDALSDFDLDECLYDDGNIKTIIRTSMTIGNRPVNEVLCDGEWKTIEERETEETVQEEPQENTVALDTDGDTEVYSVMYPNNPYAPDDIEATYMDSGFKDKSKYIENK